MKYMRRWHYVSLLLILCLLPLIPRPMAAQTSPDAQSSFVPTAAFADEAFARHWMRTDLPLIQGVATRHWTWGFWRSGPVYEPFDDEMRLVQYFDKGRMELPDPRGNRASPWFITSGLLVLELITGFVQVGSETTEWRPPAEQPLAGDPLEHNPSAPTYRALGALLDQPAPDRTGHIVDQMLHADGSITTIAPPAPATLTHFLPERGHNIPDVFWQFLQQHGPVFDGATLQHDLLVDWLFLAGYPLTEPYWIDVLIEGHPHTILVQPFERRLLTWNPHNPPDSQVEMGNVGLHYYRWRYNSELPLLGDPPGDTAPLTLQVHVSHTEIAQGHTLTLHATTNYSATLFGALAGVPLTFFPSHDHDTIAIVPAHALAPPGDYLLSIIAMDAGGGIASHHIPLRIHDAGYPTEYIALPPSVQQTLQEYQAEILAENQLVTSIWAAPPTPRRLWDEPFRMPAEGSITSRFGGRRSYDGGPIQSFHEGLDIANNAGSPVVAPAAGIVTLAGHFIVRGGAIIIDHGWGIQTGYWHLQEVLVEEGDVVRPGDLIGRIGSEGLSTGPHLHWEVRIGRMSIDPEAWLSQTQNLVSISTVSPTNLHSIPLHKNIVHELH